MILAIIRIVTLAFLGSLICIIGMFCCLLKPCDPQWAQVFAHLFARLSPLLGLKVIIRYPLNRDRRKCAVYVSNHQNNYDMVTISAMTQPRTVTVGKKNLVWIPFFGPLYWLTGNILIDRKRRVRAHNTLLQISSRIREQNISVWMFPEGTRSRGRGLMPFKMGAFYTAILAGVPIIPICASNLQNKVKLSRWQNGYVIIEMLLPIDTTLYQKEQARDLAEHCYQLMQAKLTVLNAEVALLEQGEQIQPYEELRINNRDKK